MQISLCRMLPILLLFAFSSLGLVLPNLSNACLFLLVLFSGVGMLAGKGGASGWRMQPTHLKLLSLVMVLPAIAVLIHQAGVGHYGFRDFDRPLRLAVFGLVLLSLSRIAVDRFTSLHWAWMLACVLCFIKAWAITEGGTLPNSGSLGFMAGIAFSNAVLLIGTWLLLSLQLPLSLPQRWLRIAVIMLALGVTFMVKTRGTWLVLPFYALFLTFYLRQLSVTRKIFILLLPLVLVGGAMLSSGMVKQRIYDVGSDIQAYSHGGNRETSVGQRLQIWQASWKLYVDHPWLGIGREGFKPELHEMARRGEISDAVADLPHSHNGMLFHMALWGTGGLIAWLLTYLVPMVMFWREFGHSDVRVRTYAGMGVALCLGYLIFDLTDVMFFWVILNGFYVINLAIFFNAIERAKEAGREASTVT
jgi:O-antigen ligase